MSRRRSPAASGATWALAIVFVALIDACLTRSSLLWGDTSFEHAQDLGERVFAGTYVAARKIYAPRRPAAVRIAVLGDSRFRLGLSEQGLEATLRRASQGIDARVDNLSIFGSSIGDLEVIARHLDRIPPSLTIVAVDHLTLLPTPLSGLTNLPGRLLAIGWRDGPAETTTAVERIDRWLRTAWPLYRFREFARAALIDRVPTAAGKVEPEPDRFASPDDFFRWYHPDAAAEVAAAYRSWQREPTLAHYEAYLNVVRDDYVRWVRTRTNHAERLEESSDGVRILSHMLDGLTARGPPGDADPAPTESRLRVGPRRRVPRRERRTQRRRAHLADLETARGSRDRRATLAARRSVLRLRSRLPRRARVREAPGRGDRACAR
jgi:hypothetical protein